MEHIVLSYEERVATIELNRPNALNALNEQMLAELLQALKEVEKARRILSSFVDEERDFVQGETLKRCCSQRMNIHS